MKYIRMKNGCILGCTVLKIDAVPYYTLLAASPELAQDKIKQSFGAFLHELSRFSLPNGAAIELLWMSKPIKNQTFLAKINLYIVLRVLDKNNDSVAQRMCTILGNLKNHIEYLNFRYQIIEPDAEELIEGLDRSTHPCITALKKAEQFQTSPRSLVPLFYVKPFNANHAVNLEMLIRTLSSLENATVSFQLIPSVFSLQEKYVLNEYCEELALAQSGKLAAGLPDTSASIPVKYLNYYRDSAEQPIYQYNILVMGKAEACVTVNAQLSSLLMEQGDSCFITINLSNESLQPARDFMFYPWNLNQHLLMQHINPAFFQNNPVFQGFIRMAGIATISELTGFFYLPSDSGNVKGIDSTNAMKSMEQFSERVVNDNNIKFGKLAADNHNMTEIGCPPKAFTKHALIVGTPGSGKTTFSIYLLLQFYKKKIPFLAIEPTKTEYRAMIDVIPELQIFTPGNNMVSPFVINPFIPPKGIRVEQYVPSLASAFKAAFSMPSPLDMFFLKAIRESYSAYGWKDYSMAGDPDVIPFGLYEFILIFKKLVNESDYSREVKGNMQSGGVLRLQNLIEQNSNIYDTIHSVPLEDILSKPTVFELNAIDNAEQKSLLMALLLINICVYTKHNYVGDGELKNAILIDEAHVLLGAKNGNDGQQATDTTIKALQDMIAEIRSYGTSIIIADQSPTAVSRAIVANTDIKVSFRIVQTEEKSIIAGASNMSESDTARLGRLKVGEAYIYNSLLEDPQLVQTPDIREHERIRLSVSNHEVLKKGRYWNSNKELLVPFRQCQYSAPCSCCDFKIRADAEYYANRFYSEVANKISDLPHLGAYMRILSKKLKEKAEIDLDDNAFMRLCNCVKIRFLRKFLLNRNLSVTIEQQNIILSRCLNTQLADEEGGIKS